MGEDDLGARIEALERRNRRLTGVVAALGATLAAVGVVGAAAPGSRDLTLRSLTVVDAAGTPRVRLAAPEPDPIVMGRTRRRDGPVSGVMLYDAKGNERGGYVTTDNKDYPNVFLTLDGEERQRALFLAEPNGAATLRLFKDKGNMVEMQMVGDRPALRVVEGGRTTFEQPAR